MTQVLREDTAVDVLIGPFLDITDAATAETGESPSVKLSKAGQALAAKNDATTPVSDADGYYNCELDATDTSTPGTLDLIVAATATALSVFKSFQVISQAAYDFLYTSGAAPVPLVARAILPQINTAFSDLEFLMIDSADNISPKTGLTVTGTRSIDGGAFAAVTGTIAEVGNGIYQIDATQADVNGAIITFRFAATGANVTFLTLKTAA